MANSEPLARSEGLIDGSASDPFPLHSRLRRGAGALESGDGLLGGDPVGGCNAALRGRRVLRAEVRCEGGSAIFGRINAHMSGLEHRHKTAILARRLRNPRQLTGELHQFVRRSVEECAADCCHYSVAASVSNVTGDPDVHARGRAARTSVCEFVTPSIPAARGNAGDNLLGDLSAAVYEAKPLTDHKVTSFCVFLLVAGIETTDRATVNILVQLIERPDVWILLRHEPDLVHSAIAEGLRRCPPVHGAYSDAKADVVMGDRTIRAGDPVFLVLSSANRDSNGPFQTPTHSWSTASPSSIGCPVHARRPSADIWRRTAHVHGFLARTIGDRRDAVCVTRPLRTHRLRKRGAAESRLRTSFTRKPSRRPSRERE